MEGDDDVCYFVEDLWVVGVGLVIVGEFGGEEELAGSLFFNFDVFGLIVCVISKTHRLSIFYINLQ